MRKFRSYNEVRCPYCGVIGELDDRIDIENIHIEEDLVIECSKCNLEFEVELEIAYISPAIKNKHS